VISIFRAELRGTRLRRSLGLSTSAVDGSWLACPPFSAARVVGKGVGDAQACRALQPHHVQFREKLECGFPFSSGIAGEAFAAIFRFSTGTVDGSLLASPPPLAAELVRKGVGDAPVCGAQQPHHVQFWEKLECGFPFSSGIAGEAFAAIFRFSAGTVDGSLLASPPSLAAKLVGKGVGDAPVCGAQQPHHVQFWEKSGFQLPCGIAGDAFAAIIRFLDQRRRWLLVGLRSFLGCPSSGQRGRRRSGLSGDKATRRSV
jgi:hypothetical protein